MIGQVRKNADNGTTLVEAVVAMSLFMVVMSIVVSSISVWSKKTFEQRAAADAAENSRVALARFDKIVASSEAINRPVAVGDKVYLEMLEAKTQDCNQFRLDKTERTLHIRQWVLGETPSTTWRLVARNLTDLNVFSVTQPNDAGEPKHQMLSLNVAFKTSGVDQQVIATYVARNTSVDTKTVRDLAPADGRSDEEVCLGTGVRP